jgi:hypothetical protein
MSKIVDFRERIIEKVRETIPGVDIDWYDGLFDEHDVAEWTVKVPCARVAVMNAPAKHHVTGEISTCLRVVCVIIDENRFAQLDGDARAWEMVESVALMANLNQFGDPNAGPATNVKFRRLSQPALRREGITIGVVEWESDITIGTNRARERDTVVFNGQRVTQFPNKRDLALGYIHNEAGQELRDQLDITPEVD